MSNKESASVQPTHISPSGMAVCAKGAGPKYARMLSALTQRLDQRAQKRLLSIETLRVLAIVSIAIFHTFLPWFEAIEHWAGFLAGTAISPKGHATVQALVVMGSLNQLGAWGNHVFFMISGFFLLPRAIQAAAAPSYWRTQSRRTFFRVLPILITVALYGGVALLVGWLNPKLTHAALDDWFWLSFGIQFIWVYVALVVLCPVIAWLASRTNKQAVLLVLAVLVVYAINIYLALSSQVLEESGVVDGRKLMSSISYGMSFVVGGWIADHKQATWLRAGRRAPLVAVIATVLAEFVAAHLGGIDYVRLLSYRSTSPFAFALAVAALIYALSKSQHESSAATWCARSIAFASSGTLGFYVLQAFFAAGWHGLANTLLMWALDFGFVAFLGLGVLFSFSFFVALIVLDACVRQPLLRSIQRH